MNISKLLTYSYIFFLSTFLIACSEKTITAEVEQPYHLLAQVIDVKPQESYAIERAYTGQVSIRDVSKLGFEFNGLINNVFVDNGDHVTQGQVLAEQSTELLTIKMQELQAQIEQVNAKLSLNTHNLKRITKLEKKGYSSQQALDNLTAEKEALIANLQGLKANVNSLKYQLEHTKIIAPFDGVIDARNATQGEVVAAGMPVLQLIQQGDKQVTFGLPAKLADSIRLNQVLSVTINNKDHSAKVIAIGKQVNPANRTIEVRLALDLDKAVDVFNGQLAQVLIPQKINRQGTWIPISALTDGIRGQWNIYTVNNIEQNLYKVAVKTVKVLQTNKEYAYIELTENTPLKIISEGVHRFVGGQTVRIGTNQSSKPATPANQGEQS